MKKDSHEKFKPEVIFKRKAILTTFLVKIKFAN